MNNESSCILFKDVLLEEAGVWHLHYQGIFPPNCFISEAGWGGVERHGVMIVQVLLSLFCWNGLPTSSRKPCFLMWFNLITSFLCD